MKSRRRIFAVVAMTFLSLVLLSCARKESKLMLEPGQSLGAVLAEETVQAVGTKKTVVLILPQWAANSTAVESFKTALKSQGVTVTFSLLANVGSPMDRNGVGLKSADFFEALGKSDSAGAIVSLAGPPLLNAPDMTRLNSGHPPVLVVATQSLGYDPNGSVLGVPADQNYLTGLLDAKVIQLAIVDNRDQSNTDSSGKLDATHQSFFQHYTILRSHG
jgi:hypothetical protein